MKRFLQFIFCLWLVLGFVFMGGPIVWAFAVLVSTCIGALVAVFSFFLLMNGDQE